MPENIDLSSYSLEQLKALVVRARSEIAKQEENRVREIRSQMQALANSAGISLHDILGIERGKSRGVNNKGQVKVKFRNPVNPDETWTGRGKRPRWLQQALAEGAELQDFAVS
jgi:DNA-binding protein H-NS